MLDVMDHSNFKYLGCDIETFKKHIESQFIGDWSWLNHGTEWSIDHYRPIGNKELDEEERIKRLHYLNTRPLSIAENRKKGAKEPEIFYDENNAIN